MPRKNNIWKPLNFGNPGAHIATTSSAVPLLPGPLNPRVRTSREVKRAYQARRAITSTATGAYVLTGRPAFAPESQQDDPDPSGSSTLRPTSPLEPSRSSRSSSPIDTPGWTSEFPPSPQPTSNFAHSRTTRANQWTKWTQVVIPQLVQPYLDLLHRSDSLSSVNRQFSSLCSCGQSRARTLKVTCVYFDCKSFFSFAPAVSILMTLSSYCRDIFAYL